MHKAGAARLDLEAVSTAAYSYSLLLQARER